VVELKIMKAPTEIVDPQDLKYPLYASVKLDGVRCLIKDGKIFSASMREIENKQIHAALAPLKRHKSWVFDGELYSHQVPFSTFTGNVRAHDRDPGDGWAYHIFDGMPLTDWGNPTHSLGRRVLLTTERVNRVIRRLGVDCNICMVEHAPVSSAQSVASMMEDVVDQGYEGLILRNPNSLYKHGRATVNSGAMYKLKTWVDYDGVIIEVNEMMGIKDGVERSETPTGHLRPVHKQDDLEPKGTFGHFVVELDTPPFVGERIICGSWQGLTHELRAEIWDNRDDYQGRWVRFKGQGTGAKDRPRIPKDLEFRDDK